MKRDIAQFNVMVPATFYLTSKYVYKQQTHCHHHVPCKVDCWLLSNLLLVVSFPPEQAYICQEGDVVHPSTLVSVIGSFSFILNSYYGFYYRFMPLDIVKIFDLLCSCSQNI